MAKELLITADDFGVHSVIDNGIKMCIDAGVIDCVDVIVAYHSSKWRIRRLISEYKSKFDSGELKLGLHLSLTCGSPLYRHNDDYLKIIAKKKKINKINRLIFKCNSALEIIPILDTLESKHLKSLENEMIAQYDKFVEITGHPPQHISSHIGIFHSTAKIYSFFSKFCKDRAIPMRCPSLLGLDKSMPIWKRDPKQEMFPQNHISKLLLVDNGHKTWHWIKEGVKPCFLASKKAGLSSTDFFIEHFYNQTKKESEQKKIMLNILDKIGNHSYEMVVHPVFFKHISEYRKSKVAGITAGKFNKRKAETLTLINNNLKDLMAVRGIVKYRL